ncbi:MAG: AMP-binding protein [Anaerolineae bacterium]|nr:AMP-binding protein [Anaerolineae bacterium]
MSVLSDVVREIRRGSIDRETFFWPAFYTACKRRFARMTRDEIAAYQLAKARNVVRYAARHAPFFAELYQDRDLEDVWSLPTVNKATMMANLTVYNTVGLTRQQVLDFCLHVEHTRDFSLRLQDVNVGMSSGTSGNRGVEIVTRREEAYLRAVFLARFPFGNAPPVGKNAINLAFILRVSAPAFNLNLLGNRLTYISQFGSLDQIRAQLEALQPNAVSAPPSMLRILAREKVQGRLRIAPKRLVSYAEVLYPETRTFLRERFGCPVFEIYKATEGAIAISCVHGSLHVNEDLVALELLDDEGQPVPPGTPSRRTLVTDLHKTSQPIVRYALNDIITIRPEPCPCGSAFRVIERIDGRSDDVFWGARRDTGEMQFIFPDYIRRAIITVSDDIGEYQVIQQAPDAVLVRLQVEDQGNVEQIALGVRDGLRGVFEAYNCHPPRIEIRFEPPLPNPNSNKLIRVHCAFKVDSE